MKKLISALILVLSPMAFSQETTDGVRVFSVKAAEFAPEHISNFGHGTIQIDYERNLVRMNVSRTLNCGTQSICTRMLPRPMIVELPITSVEQGHCGIRKVTAVQDDSANGLVRTLAISDASDLICRSLARFHSQAEYETTEMDLTSGQSASAKSTMLLEEIQTESAE